jgi:YVTN family beta-propeller protein
MHPKSSHRSPVLKNRPALLVIVAISAFSLARLEAAPPLTTSTSTGSSDKLNSDAELTNTVVANTSVGNYPVDGVVTPDNSTLYVTNDLTNTVSVIDTASNTLATSIRVGSFPGSLAITPDGTELYVACQNHVSIINTSTNTVSGKIDLSSGGLAVSPNGKSLYVPDAAGVQIVEVVTKKVMKTISYPYPEEAFQVLFEPNGDFAWVISETIETRNGDKGGILRINTKTFATDKCVWGDLINVGSAAITPDGSKIYVGEADKIAIFNTATRKIGGSIPITSYEYGVTGSPAVTPDGAYLYFPMLQNVLVVDTATNANAGIPIPVFESPFVTIAPNGSLAYVGAVFGTPNNYGAVLTVAITEPKNARQASPK